MVPISAQQIRWWPFDLNNNVYLETLVATDAQFINGAVVLSKSTDGGTTFASPVVAYQPSNNSVFPDKEWMAINTFAGTRDGGRVLVTFSLFSNVNSDGAPIMRVYSDNGGATWSARRDKRRDYLAGIATIVFSRMETAWSFIGTSELTNSPVNGSKR